MDISFLRDFLSRPVSQLRRKNIPYILDLKTESVNLEYDKKKL
jgi:hypothetical protein